MAKKYAMTEQSRRAKAQAVVDPFAIISTRPRASTKAWDRCLGESKRLCYGMVAKPCRFLQVLSPQCLLKQSQDFTEEVTFAIVSEPV